MYHATFNSTHKLDGAKMNVFRHSSCLIKHPLITALSVWLQLQGARVLGIPVIVSEQYPKGLGNTVQELDLTGAKLVFPKTKFSMVLPEVEAALAEFPAVRSVVLFGVEVA